MALVQSFRELNVYQQALEGAADVFEMTRVFPREERYSLTDQIRRGSRAVNAMIAEAWARCRYVAAFADKLNQAMVEAMETQAWLDHAFRCNYITKEIHTSHDVRWQGIGVCSHG